MKAALKLEFDSEQELEAFTIAHTYMKEHALTPKDERLITPEKLIVNFIRRVNRYNRVPSTAVIDINVDYKVKNQIYEVKCISEDPKHEHPICSHDICEEIAVATSSDNSHIYAWCIDHMQRTDLKLACVEITKKVVEEQEQC